MLNPEELLQIISNANIQCPITPELDEYTIEVTQKMREDRKKGESCNTSIIIIKYFIWINR